MTQLIDCHTHVGKTDSGELYYGHLRGEELLGLMEASGVGRALVFPPYLKNGYGEANRELARWCESLPGTPRCRPLARIGGRSIVLPEPQPWLIRKNIRRMLFPKKADLHPEELKRFAGIKLLPLMDGLPGKKIFEAANDLNLPFLIHGGLFTHPKWIEKHVLPKVRTKLVIAHLGAFPGRMDHVNAVIDLARSDRRVFIDTSGIWIDALIQRAVEAVPDRILFGSDCPLTHPRVAWEQITSIVADPGLRQRIGHDLAEEIFRWT